MSAVVTTLGWHMSSHHLSTGLCSHPPPLPKGEVCIVEFTGHLRKEAKKRRLQRINFLCYGGLFGHLDYKTGGPLGHK